MSHTKDDVPSLYSGNPAISRHPADKHIAKMIPTKQSFAALEIFQRSCRKGGCHTLKWFSFPNQRCWTTPRGCWRCSCPSERRCFDQRSKQRNRKILLRIPVSSGWKGRLVSLRAGVKPGQADRVEQCGGEGRGVAFTQRKYSSKKKKWTFLKLYAFSQRITGLTD